MKKLMVALVVVVAAAGGAQAQMRGMGRIEGIVTDGAGKPLAGVAISATLPGSTAGIKSTSNDKGLWYVGGLARGDWQVEFEKAGYEQRRAKVVLPVELARVPPIAITLKKTS
jgi:hypothetical protein